MKKEQAAQLYKEIQRFISSINANFRKDLIKAIELKFLKETNSDGVVIRDYETNYLDKYHEIKNFLSKALSGGYCIELWEHSMMSEKCTFQDFILTELRLSLRQEIPPYRKSDFSPLDDGDE